MKPSLAYMLCVMTFVLSPMAQAKSSALDSFLSSALGDFKVTLQEKNREEFGDRSGFKPIEGIQIRGSQNELIEDRKIELRIKPRGYGQLKALSALASGQHRIENLASKKAITKALSERYLAVVQYINAFETSRLWSSIVSVRSKRMSMLQSAVRASVSKATDLIKERETLEEAEVAQGLASSDLKIAASRLKLLDPNVGDISARTSDLPTPAAMLKIVSQMPAGQSLEIDLARERAARERQSLDYEIAKDDRLLDFVALSYTEGKNDRQFGVKAGFNVPGFASGELNRSEKARELVKYEVDAREAQREEALTQSSAKEALAQTAELYQSMNVLDKSGSEKRLRRLVNRQDPLLASTIQDDGLQRELRLIQVSSKAFEAYFKFLASTGWLAERAKTNFLTRDLRDLR